MFTGKCVDLPSIVQGACGRLDECICFLMTRHLHRFNFIRNEHLEDYGIKYDHVFSMYEDKEHNLWLGTDQGVYAVNPTEHSFNTVKAQVKGKPADISITNFLATADKQFL